MITAAALTCCASGIGAK